MHKRNTTSPGFTIVELLIVVVVIAILAAISIVAYTNIQNRANDSAVRKDLSDAQKALELYQVDHGEYPDTLAEINSMNATAPFTVSKSSYMTGNIYNFALCVTSSAFGLIAQSKSGLAFYITNTNGSVQESSSWQTVLSGNCSYMGISSPTFTSWGYRGDTQEWQPWVRG